MSPTKVRRFNTTNKIKGSYNAGGKDGEWNYYTNTGSLDKVLTFKNGILIKEEYINLLNYKSIEKTREIIQKTWAYNSNLLTTIIKEKTSTYTFGKNGEFTAKYIYPKMKKNKDDLVHIRKGNWTLTTNLINRIK